MRKFVIIIVLCIIAFGVWWYVVVRNTGKSIPQAARQISFPLVGNIVNRITGSGSGYGGDTHQINTDTTLGTDTVETKKPVERLEQIVPTPVAGYTVFSTQKVLATDTTTNPKTKNTATKTDFSTNNYIRYVDRGNGYVYEIANNGIATQITNIYIPNIHEAFFGDTGKKAFLRFLRDDQKTIATFAVPIAEPNLDGSRTQLSGSFLPDNISSFAVSPDTSLIAMLAPNTTGGTVLTVANTNNMSRKDILNTPFRDWLVSWTAQDRVSVQTKPAGTVDGYFYTILQTDLRLKKILGGIYGLTASLSPQGSYVIDSESTANGFLTKIYTINTGASSTLAFQALPEKCIWIKDENLICATMQNPSDAMYPDSWYAGLTHFRDKVVRMSPRTGLTTLLYDGEKDFDVVSLQFDEKNNKLYFINKNDGSLWRLNL